MCLLEAAHEIAPRDVGLRNRGDEAATHAVHPTMIHHGKKVLSDGAEDIVKRGGNQASKGGSPNIIFIERPWRALG